MAVTLSRSNLEVEHQRLAHIGKSKLLELAKKGELNYTYEQLKDDPFDTSKCTTCQTMKAIRDPKARIDLMFGYLPVNFSHGVIPELSVDILFKITAWYWAA